MRGYRAYLVGIGTMSPAVPPTAWSGRHRSSGRRWSWRSGRHRAHAGAPRRASGPRPVRLASRRRALPAGLATLLVILTVATVVSGWSAASGAVAIVGMIAR